MQIDEAELRSVVDEIERLRELTDKLMIDRQTALDIAHDAARLAREESAWWHERHSSLRAALIFAAALAAVGWLLAAVSWWRM